MATKVKNQTYEKRKNLGQCMYCDSPSLPGKVRCQLHAEIASDYCKGRRDIRILKGLCARCGKKNTIPKFRDCPDCRKKKREEKNKLKLDKTGSE